MSNDLASLRMNLRGHLLHQAIALLVGIVFIFACQASMESAKGLASNLRAGFSGEPFEGFCIASAFAAFAWAGRIRFRINRLLREIRLYENESSLDHRIEAA